MDHKKSTRSHFFLTCVIAAFLFSPAIVFSQAYIRGQVVYQKDATPAESATIELSNQKESGLSDRSGNFSIYLSKLKQDDTLLISSVGYETLKIPVSSALKRSKFELVEKTRNMDAVVVFSQQQVIGSSVESVGYFRSWNTKNTGGEIGRIFKVPYSQYKIDKIRFKVSNFCDTCLLRLHMRNVADGYPGEEILKDPVTVTINKLNLADKVPEFDLSPYNLTFTQKEIFVSIEVLNCTSKNAEYCSFSFAGTEKGAYVYKPGRSDQWLTTDDYTIHLKLFLRY